MSATVAAALKKLAVAVLTDKKPRKAVFGIALGILMIILMPIAAVLALFNGALEFDTGQLQEMIVQNLTAEQEAQMQAVEDTMYAIQDAMTAAGFSGRTVDAQVLFVLALQDYAHQQDFLSKLVGCFSENQSDGQLIAAVNAAFGTALSGEDFRKVMASVRGVKIDTSGYVDLSTKNNLDLVQWAIAAEKAGWGYVWGTYGQVLDQALYDYKLEQYPEEVGGYAEFIEQHWLGRRCADCIGLLKGYSWFDPESGAISYGANGMPDVDADSMYELATEKGSMDTMPEIPGLAVWHRGHIGIYIGNGQVIEAMGTRYGAVQTQLSSGAWTHWLKIPYIQYIEAPAPTEEVPAMETTLPTENP